MGLTLGLKLCLGVKGEDGISNGVRTEARLELKMGLEMGLSESQFVTKVWLSYFNLIPIM